MALGDKQVLNSQVADGNSDYLIPGAVSLQLKAVSAEFVDNGAAGDWLPAVVAISDSGHVFWRALDQGVKVTAGSDAEVSWFPGVKHAAAAASTGGVAYSRGFFNNSFSGDPVVPILGGGVGNRIPFAHVDADPSGAITWTQTTNPNDTANLNTAGIYTVEGNARMDTAASGQEILVKGANTLAEQYSQLPWKSQYNGGIIDSLGVATQETHALYRVTNTPVLISLFAMSNAAVNLGFAYLAIIYHGAV